MGMAADVVLENEEEEEEEEEEFALEVYFRISCQAASAVEVAQ